MAVKPIYAAGLDAGSRRTRLVICVLENSRIRFAGASAVESQGWAKGRIADRQAVPESVTAAPLAVEESVFEGLAACYAAVLPENRREGIAVVDIGAQSTELVIYYGDAMHLASTVPICGDHFTRDLAQGLCLSFEDAELVKMEFGCALSQSSPENVLVELPTRDGRPRRDEKRKMVNRILEAPAHALFKYCPPEFRPGA